MPGYMGSLPDENDDLADAVLDDTDYSVDALVVGEVEGWRVCHFNGTELTAYNADYVWKPGENVAVCTATHQATKQVLRNKADGSGVELVEVMDHTAIPDPNCGCGFWMYKSSEGLKAKGPQRGGGYLVTYPYRNRTANNGFGSFAPAGQTGYVVVQVKGWGRVVEGADGYRCEYASITAIVDTGDSFLGELAEKYKVPLVEQPDNLDKNPDVIEGQVVSVSPKEMGRGLKPRPSTVEVSVATADTNSSATTHTLKIWPDNATYRLLEQGVGGTFRLHTSMRTSRWGQDRFIHRAYRTGTH